MFSAYRNNLGTRRWFACPHSSSFFSNESLRKHYDSCLSCGLGQEVLRVILSVCTVFAVNGTKIIRFCIDNMHKFTALGGGGIEKKAN